MQIRKSGDVIIIRLDKGDEIFASLLKVCGEYSVAAGSISGIGAVSGAVLAVYDTEKKAYSEKRLEKAMEIASLTGNAGLLEGKPYLHLHAVFADKEFHATAGHLKSAVIGATGEIFLRILPEPLEHRFNSVTGLNEIIL